MAVFLLILIWAFGEKFADRVETGMAGVAIAFALLALVFPTGLYFPYRAWILLGNVLNAINSRIILLVLFYVVFTPMGLLRRIFGADPMGLKKSDQQSFLVYQDEEIQMNKPY